MAKRIGKAELMNFSFRSNQNPDAILAIFDARLKSTESRIIKKNNGLEIESAYLSVPVGIVVGLISATLVLLPLALILRKAAESKGKLAISVSPDDNGTTVIVVGTVSNLIAPVVREASQSLQ